MNPTEQRIMDEVNRGALKHPPFAHPSHAAGVIEQCLHDIRNALMHRGLKRSRINHIESYAAFMAIAATAARAMQDCYDVTQEEIEQHLKEVSEA